MVKNRLSIGSNRQPARRMILIPAFGMMSSAANPDGQWFRWYSIGLLRQIRRRCKR